MVVGVSPGVTLVIRVPTGLVGPVGPGVYWLAVAPPDGVVPSGVDRMPPAVGGVQEVWR
jgi:hypothetical protein